MVNDAQAAAELPLDGAGLRLARARESAGLTRAQLAAQTKIPERHIETIESGDFAALPARTYAVGFSRSYARAVGLDENEIVTAVRDELALIEPAPPRYATNTFEPGDPARVPSARFAWLLGLAAVAVVGAAYLVWPSIYAPGANLPEVAQAETDQSALPGPVPASTTPVGAASGPVVFTALDEAVWVKFYDGSGTQLLQKELAKGETYTVPDAPGVQLWTARPDALAITIGGQPVPKLSDVQRMIKDVAVSAAALAARGSAQPVTSAPASEQAVQAAPPAAAPLPRRIVRERAAVARNEVAAAAVSVPAPVAAGAVAADPQIADVAAAER